MWNEVTGAFYTVIPPCTRRSFCQVWHDSFIYEMSHLHATWLIHMRHHSAGAFCTAIPPSPRGSWTLLPCVTWLIYMWNVTFTHDVIHSYVTSLSRCLYTVIPPSPRGSWALFPYLTWLIHMCHDSLTRDMTHPCATWLRRRLRYSHPAICTRFVGPLVVRGPFYNVRNDTFMCDSTHLHAT